MGAVTSEDPLYIVSHHSEQGIRWLSLVRTHCTLSLIVVGRVHTSPQLKKKMQCYVRLNTIVINKIVILTN